MTSYFDASAILRILFHEDGPSAPLRPGGEAASSQLVEVETFRALDRERLLGNLDDETTAVKSKELSELLAAMHLAPISEEVLAMARATFPVIVRSLDAIHVATAQLLLREAGPLEFWTHDQRQANAALSRGLDVRGL